MPEVADANANVQPAEFNPANVKPGEVPNLPPEQRQKWLQWKQEQDAQKNAARPKPAPSPTGGGGHNRGGGSFFAPVAGGEVPFGRGRPAPSRHGEIPFGQQPAGRLPSNVPPTANTPPQPGMQQQELPSSPFSPAQQLKDLEIWAHDETTIPGKVYRYKLRISIKSPLWGTQGMAKNPDDANVFVLTAETEWSKPIPSPSKQDFFVSTGGSTVGGVPKVGIDYFKWDDGTWKQTYVTLQPGDRVGETPWTIVDLRPIGNSAGDNRVVLVSDTGDMSSRFYKTDKANPRYNALHGLANPIAPAGTTPNSPQAGLNPGPTATGAAGGGRHSRTD